jgi:hypothetical protein
MENEEKEINISGIKRISLHKFVATIYQAWCEKSSQEESKRCIRYEVGNRYGGTREV